MDMESAKIVFAVVAGVVASDQRLSDSEKKFLDGVQLRFCLSDEDRAAIEPIVGADGAAAAVKRLPADQRGVLLELVLTATMADGIVAPEEIELVNAVRAAVTAE